MNNVARAFDENSRRNSYHGLSEISKSDLPWLKLREEELPPMMFQLRHSDGSMTSYPYSGLCEIHCRDAGQMQLSVHGMGSVLITLEGRHLRELANLLSCAMVRWIEEADPREIGRAESEAEVVKITVEELEN